MATCGARDWAKASSGSSWSITHDRLAFGTWHHTTCGEHVPVCVTLRAVSWNRFNFCSAMYRSKRQSATLAANSVLLRPWTTASSLSRMRYELDVVPCHRFSFGSSDDELRPRQSWRDGSGSPVLDHAQRPRHYASVERTRLGCHGTSSCKGLHLRTQEQIQICGG